MGHVICPPPAVSPFTHTAHLARDWLPTEQLQQLGEDLALGGDQLGVELGVKYTAVRGEKEREGEGAGHDKDEAGQRFAGEAETDT
jgi:hypothetical protein